MLKMIVSSSEETKVAIISEMNPRLRVMMMQVLVGLQMLKWLSAGEKKHGDFRSHQSIS